MKTLQTLIAIILCFCLTGCASLKTSAFGQWFVSHQPQLKASAQQIAGIVSRDAFQIVLQSAVSFADGQNKSDYLQGLEGAFYANSTNLLTSNDVKNLVLTWTPAATGGPEHWTELANSIADAYVKAHPTDPAARKAVAAAIAKGLEDAVNANKSA